MTDTRRRKRVLLVIKGLGRGGAERLLVDMVAQGSGDFSYEVAYILNRYDDLVPALNAIGTSVHALGATRDFDLRWISRLRRILLQRHYDIVHFHLPYSAALGRLATLTLPARERPKTLYTEHSQWNLAAVLLRIANRATSPLDDALIVVSESGRDALPRSLRSRANVIVHGIDLSTSPQMRANRASIRSTVRTELGIGHDEILVLTVANLRAEKGYEVLMSAAADLLARGNMARFLSVGTGPLADALRSRHDELGLGDHFRFLGQRDDVLRIMTAADVFVLASHFEGLPVTIMEATSVGLPVVATSVGEIPRLLTHDVDALLVPPARPRELAQSLERVITDADLRNRLSDRSIERSTELFEVSAAIRKVEAIYRSLLD